MWFDLRNASFVERTPASPAGEGPNRPRATQAMLGSTGSNYLNEKELGTKVSFTTSVALVTTYKTRSSHVSPLLIFRIAVAQCLQPTSDEILQPRLHGRPFSPLHKGFFLSNLCMQSDFNRSALFTHVHTVCIHSVPFQTSSQRIHKCLLCSSPCPKVSGIVQSWHVPICLFHWKVCDMKSGGLFPVLRTVPIIQLHSTTFGSY